MSFSRAMYNGLCNQIVRLTAAGYPYHFVLATIWDRLKKIIVEKALPKKKRPDRIAVFTLLTSCRAQP